MAGWLLLGDLNICLRACARSHACSRLSLSHNYHAIYHFILFCVLQLFIAGLYSCNYNLWFCVIQNTNLPSLVFCLYVCQMCASFICCAINVLLHLIFLILHFNIINEPCFVIQSYAQRFCVQSRCLLDYFFISLSLYGFSSFFFISSRVEAVFICCCCDLPFVIRYYSLYYSTFELFLESTDFGYGQWRKL